MNQKNYTIAMETRSAIYLGKGVFLVPSPTPKVLPA